MTTVWRGVIPSDSEESHQCGGIVIPSDSEESHLCGVGEISPPDQIRGRNDKRHSGVEMTEMSGSQNHVRGAGNVVPAKAPQEMSFRVTARNLSSTSELGFSE